MWTIEGKSGIPIEVTVRNMLWEYGPNVSPQYFVTYKDRMTWTISTTQTAGAPGDYFCYLRNSSQTRDLMITNVQVQALGAEVVQVNGVNGTPTGGTAIVPFNRALGNNNSFSGVLEGAATIGGLSTLGQFQRIVHTAVGLPEERDLMARPIFLPRQQNAAFGVGFAAEVGGVVINLQFDVMIQSIDVDSLQ